MRKSCEHLMFPPPSRWHFLCSSETVLSQIQPLLWCIFIQMIVIQKNSYFKSLVTFINCKFVKNVCVIVLHFSINQTLPKTISDLQQYIYAFHCQDSKLAFFQRCKDWFLEHNSKNTLDSSFKFYKMCCLLHSNMKDLSRDLRDRGVMPLMSVWTLKSSDISPETCLLKHRYIPLLWYVGLR